MRRTALIFILLFISTLVFATEPTVAERQAEPIAANEQRAEIRAVPTPSPKTEVNEAELKKNCDLHFPGLLQSGLRPACAAGGNSYFTAGKSMGQTECRLTYGLDPRQVMACFIGVSIAEDLALKKDDFSRKYQACASYYPNHTELDLYLLESCLTGIHLPRATGREVSADLCEQISSERAYLGPCNVGLTLIPEAGKAVLSDSVSQQNKICEQYFDHKQFHLGYRACLNARALGVKWSGQSRDILKDCSSILSDKRSESERAACVVGLSIYQSLLKTQKPSERYSKCGENSKVSYEERDYLACLTAASLLDFAPKKEAAADCKEIFSDKKSKSRNGCTASLDLF